MVELGTFAVLVVLYSFVSGRLDGTPVTAPMVFVAAGIVAAATGELDVGLEIGETVSAGGVAVPTVDVANESFVTVAELALALVLFTDAARIDLRRLRGNAALPARLLLLGLPVTIALGGGVAAGLFEEQLLLWEAFVLAAVLAPTDAALGQAVVSNRKLPVRIRQSLNVESGLNDGLAVPLFTIFLTLAVAEEEVTPLSAGTVILEKLGYGLLIGVAVGLIGGLLLDASWKRGWTTGVFQQLGIAGMAVTAFWAAEEIGGSGFIAAFVGGIATAYSVKDVGIKVVDFTEDVGQLLNLFVFFVFGLVVVELVEIATWRMVAYAVLMLTALRMLPVAVSLIGTGLRPVTVAFLGWFGPRGLASIILALIVVVDESELAGGGVIVTTMAVAVLMSVFAHGLTAAPGVGWYARRAETMPEAAPEMGAVPELPTRLEAVARLSRVRGA